MKKSEIFSDKTPYIVAEIGINHGGSVKNAFKLIEAAQSSGANAVKLQTFDTSEFLSKNSEYYDVFKKYELSQIDITELVDFANELKIDIFSACFDPKSASFWNDLQTPIFKVASGDITYSLLLEQLADYGKPIMLSTGASSISDVEEAVSLIQKKGYTEQLIILHCVSKYPTHASEANLHRMLKLKSRFGCKVGFSDHTQGIGASVAAVALGASVIEKHFTLDKNLDGPDHRLSSTPDEMRMLVASCREAAEALIPNTAEVPEGLDIQRAIRRSLFAKRDVSKGEVFSNDMMSIKRPGNGLSPKNINYVIGKIAKRNIKKDSLIDWDDIEDND